MRKYTKRTVLGLVLQYDMAPSGGTLSATEMGGTVTLPKEREPVEAWHDAPAFSF